jgi:hypothetical protein
MNPEMTSSTDDACKGDLLSNLLLKSGALLGLGALSLSLTGCGQQTEQLSLDGARREIDPQASIRILHVQSGRASVKLTNEVQQGVYDTCYDSKITVLAYSKILNQMGFSDSESIQIARGQFERTLNDSYQALLRVEMLPEIGAEVRQALADTRRDMLMVARTSESGRLTARTGNYLGHSTVDGNAEMLYGLVANLDTVMARLNPPAR